MQPSDKGPTGQASEGTDSHEPQANERRVSRRRFVKLGVMGGAMGLALLFSPSDLFASCCTNLTSNNCNWDNYNSCTTPGMQNTCQYPTQYNYCTDAGANHCDGTGSQNTCSSSAVKNLCDDDYSNNCYGGSGNTCGSGTANQCGDSSGPVSNACDGAGSVNKCVTTNTCAGENSNSCTHGATFACTEGANTCTLGANNTTNGTV